MLKKLNEVVIINEDQTEQRNYDNAVTSAQGAINNNSNPVLDKIQLKV